MPPYNSIKFKYIGDPSTLAKYNGFAISQFNILKDQLSLRNLSQGRRQVRRGPVLIECKKVGPINQVSITDEAGQVALNNKIKYPESPIDPLVWDIVVTGSRVSTATDDTQKGSFTLDISSGNPRAMITYVSASTYLDVDGVPTSTNLGKGNPLNIDSLIAKAGEPPEPITYKVFILGYAWDSERQYGASFSGINVNLTVNPYSSIQPVAVTGPDQVVEAPFDNDGTTGVWVTVDGSASYDPDGTVEDWEWSWDDASGHHIVPGETASLSIIGFGTHTVTLLVTDDSGRQSSATTSISIVDSNKAPVAKAQSPASVMCDQGASYASFILDGSGTTDPNIGDTSSGDVTLGDSLTYTWTENGIQIASGISPRVTAPIGLHTYTLEVKDKRGLTSTDTTTTEVIAYLALPVAIAGPDITATVTSSPSGTVNVTLDGSRSYSPTGTITAYAWYYNSAWQGGGATLLVNAPVGTREYTLAVTDDQGQVATDSVNIIVDFKPAWILIIPSSETTKTATDYTQAVNFSITATSSSPYNYIVSTTWVDAQTGAVLGTGVTFNTSLTAVGGDNPSNTTRTMRCIATDNYGTTLNLAFIIIAKPFISSPPHAVVTEVQAGIFLIPDEGIIVSLDGTASYSADDQIAQYDWYWAVGGNASPTNYDLHFTGPTPAITLHNYGVYYITLVVTDRTGSTGINQNAAAVNFTDTNEAPIASFNVSSTNLVANSSHVASVSCTSTSTDANIQYGDSLSFSWLLDGVQQATTEDCTLIIPEGVHRITLSVTDLRKALGSVYLDITVQAYTPPNTDPVANAGANQTKHYTVSGQYPSFTLNGGSSYDPDGDTITYNWYNGNTLLSHASSFVWTPGKPGSYTVSLQVVDSHGAVNWDTCVLTVTFSAYWDYKTITQYYSTTGGSITYPSAWYSDWYSVMLSGVMQQYVKGPAAPPAGYTYVNSDIKVLFGANSYANSQNWDLPLFKYWVFSVPGRKDVLEHGEVYDRAYFAKKHLEAYLQTYGADHSSSTSDYHDAYVTTVGPSTLLRDSSLDASVYSETYREYTGIDMSGETWFSIIYATYAPSGYANVDNTVESNVGNNFHTRVHLSRFRKYITS